MRNLKRALSLALSTVMLLGMMVVGTSASYKDVTSEHNQEAIDVMKAVGVMIGDDKGNFNPDKNVTRAEMAVVMANLLDLKVSDFNAAKLPFTDVPQWAAPYVAACYADGITAGTSATTYGSNNTVTAAQSALMMMKALGYFQSSSDFGDDWQLATVKQASKIELFDGIDVGASAAMTRNDVAQIALNTLEATMVENDDSGLNIKGDGYEITTNGGKYVDVKNSKFDYAGDEDDDVMQLCEKLYGKDIEKNSKADDFGRPGTTWMYEGDKVAFGSDKADAIMDGDDFDKDALEDLSEDYTVVASYYNGVNFIDNKDAKEYYTKLMGTKGATIELYEDDDKITVVAIEGYVAQIDEINVDDDDEVTDVKVTVYEAGRAINNKGEYTFTVDAEDDEDAYNLIKGYDEDDVFMAFLKSGWDEKMDADKAFLGVDDVKTVEGEVTAKSADAYYNGWVKIDGEKYTFANEYSQVEVKTESDGVFYLYNDYIVHFDGEANDPADEYLYVVRSNSEQDKWDKESYFAEVVFADGTAEVVDLDKVDGTAKKADAGVYTYTYDEDDDNYTLKAADTSAEKVSIEKGKTAIKNAAGTKVASANSKTIFVNVKLDGTKFDDASVYTGYKNVKSIDGNAYIVEDGAAKIIFVVDGKAVSDNDELIYVAGESVSDLISDKDLGDYYTYNAIVDGKVVEIMVDAAMEGADELDGLYNESATNDDDIYTELTNNDVEATIKTNTKFEKAADEVITIAGEALAYADDCTVFVVDTDGDIVTGSINRNYSNVDVTYTTNDDGEVTCAYIVKLA